MVKTRLREAIARRDWSFRRAIAALSMVELTRCAGRRCWAIKYNRKAPELGVMESDQKEWLGVLGDQADLC